MTDKLIDRIKADQEGRGFRYHYMDEKIAASYGPWVRAEDYDALLDEVAEALKAADKALEKFQHALRICADDPSRFEEAWEALAAYNEKRGMI